MSDDGAVRLLVERSFRAHWRAIVLVLTRRFGPANLDLIENAAQDAMIRAMEVWPVQGVPDNPGGWIKRVAHNAVIDRLRRATAFAARADEIGRHYYPESSDQGDGAGPLDDDALKMMLICCHPVLGRRAQVALILRTLSGFGIREIAQALLSRDAAVQKLLTRAKHRIRERNLPFELPASDDMAARVDGALDALYLMFNEGYLASSGARLVRRELCAEAMRMVDLILRARIVEPHKAFALAALMHLQASRLSARADETGRLVTIAEQDRGLWDRDAIRRGIWLLGESMGGARSTFHVQAAIAACHATAPSYEETDWGRIRALYDDLLGMTASPVVALNRAVAVMMTDGEDAALAELTALGDEPALRTNHLLPALTAEALRRKGQAAAACNQYTRAIELAGNEPVCAYLRARRAETEFDYA